MKKKFVIITLLVMLLSLSACTGRNSEKATRSFEATVTEIYDSSMIVCPVEGSDYKCKC